MSRKAKVRADCRADTRGGSWAGIPKCLIDSAAYRDLSLHARAILIELTARMNGWNNGAIAVSQRELREAIGCRPQRITDGVAELMEHGVIDVGAEGKWKERQARQYRLTFVTTKGSGATNDYLHWHPLKAKSGVTDAVTAGSQSATDAVTVAPRAATDVVTARIAGWRKSVDRETSAATDVVTLICMPSPPAQPGGSQGDQHSIPDTLSPAGVHSASGTGKRRCCDQCGDEYELGREDRAYPRRFCSVTCRKRAESARAYARRQSGGHGTLSRASAR